MEASFVVPGPLDVAGTLSRFHLWGEDPASRFANPVARRALERQVVSGPSSVGTAR